MLDLRDPEKMTREVKASEDDHKDWMEKIEQMRQAYLGRAARDETGLVEWPENHPFEYLSFMVPKIAYDNPRVRATSRREPSERVLRTFRQRLEEAVMTGIVDMATAAAMVEHAEDPQLVAQAMQHGLNRWVRDSGYQELTNGLAYDYLLGPGATAVTVLETFPGDDPRNPDARLWPMTYRVGPWQALCDSQAFSDAEVRWRAHWAIRDKEDLLELAEQEEGWDVEAIKNLKTSAIPSRSEYGHASNRSNLGREELVLYYLWCPEYTEDEWPGPDEGYNGAKVVYGRADTDQGSGGELIQLKAPSPFFGPRCGPYGRWGCYVVPDKPYSLSPLMATWYQQSELNRHARAMSRNAEQYKRLVLVSADNVKLVNELKNSPDMYVIPIKGKFFDKDQVVTVEVGGMSEKQLEHYAFFRDRLERVTGMTDTQRGKPVEGRTATAEAAADAAAENRTGYVHKQFAQGTTMDLGIKAWYFAKSKEIRFPLGPDASEALGMLMPVFEGGGDNVDPEDLELTLDMYSTARQTEALVQRRVMDAFQIITASAQMMVASPYIDWEDMLKKVGDALNMPDLYTVIDYGMIQEMAGLAEPGQNNVETTSVDGFQRREAARNTNGELRPATSLARERGRESALASTP